MHSFKFGLISPICYEGKKHVIKKPTMDQQFYVPSEGLGNADKCLA